MQFKAICRDFDRECEFLQGTYNGAAFNMALPVQKPLRNFQCNEYHLDSLIKAGPLVWIPVKGMSTYL